MDDVNSVVLVARLTSDPELRSLASGQSVCSLRVAFNSSRKTGSGWEDQGNFVNVTVWGQPAESCVKFLSKGSRVAIKGRLAWREWEGEGGKRTEVSITGDRVQFLDPPKGTINPTPPRTDHNQYSQADSESVPF